MEKSIKIPISTLKNVPKKRCAKYALVLTLCVIAELFIANYSALSLKMSGVGEQELELAKAKFPDIGSSIIVGENGAFLKEGTLLFEDVDETIRSICIETSNGSARFADVSIGFTDENFSDGDALELNGSTHTIYIGEKNNKNYINVSSYGTVNKLKIEFKHSGGGFNVTSIKLNSAPPLRFSALRFSLLFISSMIYFLGVYKYKYRSSDKVLILLSTVMICVFIGIMTIMQFAAGEPLLDRYPLENEYTNDQYEQLFTAFHEGRLDITVETDPDELAALDNPYDITQRDAAEVSGDYWDRAYYNGKFYSYFGTAPVFTVYLPVYLLTGSLPSSVLASSIVTCYAVIFLSLLYLIAVEHFCKGVPLVPVLLGHLALIFGSSIFMQCAEKLFYYIAVISGIGSLAAFLFFILAAFYQSETKRRAVLLFFAGLSVVLIAASRPNMLIFCFSAAIPAYYVLLDKSESAKRKILYVCSLLVPVIAGAGLLMTYNHRRFDSVFEFGFTYQMTVSNAAANAISLSYLPAALYHYFLQLPSFEGRFPYIELNGKLLDPYPRYTYTNWSVGAFAYPAAWGMFLPYNSDTDKKADKLPSQFMRSLIIMSVILAFIDMCKAGIHYRYVSDILIPILLVGIIKALAFLSDEHEKSKAPARVYLYTVICFILTVIVGWLLIFTNENEFFMWNWADITHIFFKI